jgi:hypothetical protein
MSNDDLLDDVTEGAPDVSEKGEEAPEEATAETERPSPDLPSPPLPDFVPNAALLQLMGEAVKTRHELESVRAQKTASAKAFGEREKAIDLKLGELLEDILGELLEDIDSRTWHERFVEEEGLCYRTNRLTGETETRPYTPPPQRELSFDALESPEPDEPEPEPELATINDLPMIKDFVTFEWQTCAAIAQAAGSTPKEIGPELRALVEAGVVESEGKTRGKTYRLVAS